ncbi:MAG: endonuclease, partial [Elusimicrobia bacterium]|nr:endonuclease [Elusimicrobiota bacterium]
MFRPSMSALAALLLALPLQAQIARVTASFSPVRGAPAVARIVSPTAPSPLAPSPLPAASALVPALSLPASLTALDVVIPDAARPAAPLEDWASRFDFQPGEQFFDGGRALRSEAGATFAYAPKRGGAVRVHIVERAPLAETKAVPGTEGLSGATLLDALHAISGKGHRERAYNEASDYLFSTADQVAINGVRGVVDAYSGVFVPGTSKDGVDYPETGDANGDGFADKDGMNVEHTVPQSVFKQALPMRSDLHHL